MLETNSNLPTNPKFKNLTGQIFGKLTVIKFVDCKIYARWLCECSCDAKNQIIIIGASLTSGNTRSCGCLKNELTSIRRKKHGLSNSDEYFIWAGMKSRCLNKNESNYHNYGGRGIKVCDRWVESFENFYEDMGPRPGPEYSIERKNNDGDYEKDNCRWATNKEQNNNKRTNRYIEYNGKIKTLSQWAEAFNIRLTTLAGRLEDGWTIKEAFETPIIDNERIIEIDGESMNIASWCIKFNINRKTFQKRIRRGWSVQDAITLPINTNKNIKSKGD